MKFALALAAALLAASPCVGQSLEALEAAEDVTTAIWGEMALTQRAVTFVPAESTGYGLYEKREGAVFKKGEPLVTYVEPVGYDFETLKDGRLRFGFVVDAMLKTEDGTVVTDQKGFLKAEKISQTENQEFSLDLTITINGAPEGAYTLVYTIHDIVADESSSFEQQFEIAG